MSFYLTRALYNRKKMIFSALCMCVHVVIYNDFMNIALYLNDPKSVDSSRCRWSYATRDQWHTLYYLTL